MARNCILKECLLLVFVRNDCIMCWSCWSVVVMMNKIPTVNSARLATYILFHRRHS